MKKVRFVCLCIASRPPCANPSIHQLPFHAMRVYCPCSRYSCSVYSCSVTLVGDRLSPLTRRFQVNRAILLTGTTGLRAVCSHRHTSPTSGRLRDWPGLHFYDAEAPATSHQGRGKESHSGTHILVAVCWPIARSVVLTCVRQACLNAPEPASSAENGVDDSPLIDSPEEPTNAHLPPQQQQQARPGMPQNHMPPNYMGGVPIDPVAYSNYVQQTRGAPQYAMPQSGLQQHSSHQS
jgi:hypothetical protein